MNFFWVNFDESLRRKLRKLNFYLDMDHFWVRIHQVRSNRLQHEPLQCFSKYAQVEAFAQHQTVKEIKLKNWATDSKNWATYSVFSFSNLEDSEFLTACTEHDKTSNFIVYLIGFVFGFNLPFGLESNQEFLPVHSTLVCDVKPFGNCFNFETFRWCLCELIKIVNWILP